MNFYELTKEYLQEEAKRLAEPVIEFSKKVIVSEDNLSLEKEQCQIAYREAVNAMTQWCRKILLAEMSISHWLNNVRYRLILPGNECIEEEVCSEKASCFKEPEISEEIEMFQTPIGEMTEYMYHAITTIPQNPVKLFYEFLNENIQHMYYSMDIYSDGGYKSKVLSKDALEAYNIFDYLDIYKLGTLLWGIRDFFNSKDVGAGTSK